MTGILQLIQMREMRFELETVRVETKPDDQPEPEATTGNREPSEGVPHFVPWVATDKEDAGDEEGGNGGNFTS